MSDIIHIKKLYSACMFDLAPMFATKCEQHEHWELVYIDSGSVGYITEQASGKLGQGEIIFHRPGEVHRTVCDGKTGAAIFSFIFDCRSPAMEYFSGKSMRVRRELLSMLRQLINECARTYYVSMYPLKKRPGAPRGGEQLIRNLAESFLILLMRADVQQLNMTVAPQAEADKDNLAASVRRYLEKHVGERITLDMLAQRFHFGKTHLCGLFKAAYGESIMNCYTRLKIAEAKRMLREEELNISEISERLGFESPEYFSRCFSKSTGYSPRDFRGMLITSSKTKRE